MATSMKATVLSTEPVVIELNIEASPLSIVILEDGLDWLPLYGVKDGQRVPLPPCFALSKVAVALLNAQYDAIKVAQTNEAWQRAKKEWARATAVEWPAPLSEEGQDK